MSLNPLCRHRNLVYVAVHSLLLDTPKLVRRDVAATVRKPVSRDTALSGIIMWAPGMTSVRRGRFRWFELGPFVPLCHFAGALENPSL